MGKNLGDSGLPDWVGDVELEEVMERKMKKTVANFFLVVILASCASYPTATVTPTTQFTATITPTETPVPTITPTPVPSIQVDGFNLPDPAITNPELFDLDNDSAPIPQFISAMAMAGLQISTEQVIAELQYQRLKDIHGDPFYVAIYHLDPDAEKQGEDLEGDFPLLIATNEDNEWAWDKLTLNAASSLRGVKFGVLLNLAANAQDVTAEQFGSGVTYIGWEYTHLSPQKYDWQELNFHIGYSKQNKLQVIAVPLIWGQNVPDWVKQTADSPEKLHEIMLSHVDTAVNRFYGRVDYWEVVNEANHLGRDIFWINLGPSYVNEAFARARSIDRGARLFYNDYIDLYSAGNIDQDKRIGVIEQVVTSLLDDGNIDAIGIQIDASLDTANLVKLQEGLERLKRFGLPIIISEFSLRINGPGTPANIRENPAALARQSEVAGEIMQILQDCGCVTEIDQWGLPDDLTNAMNGNDANAGLYREENSILVPKPIVYGIIASFVFATQGQ